MSLLNLPNSRNRKSSAPRRARVFRPAMQPYLENLEQRTVLSGPGSAMVAAAVMHSPLSITDIHVTNLAATGANTLTATATLTGAVNTRTGSTPFTLPNLQLPITVTSTTPTNGVPILHLSLQIPDLNVLGLHVRLDNCKGGPVTVDLTAIPGGGLLGDLLGGVTNLLNSSGGLLNLGNLTNPTTGANATAQLTGGLTTILNGLLTDLTTGSTTAPGGTGGTMGTGSGTTDTIPARDTELVNLHLGPINANILGLQLQTSQICLNVFADPKGGLLGGLLSSLDHLLNNHGHNGHAQNVLARNILRDLTRLGL